jgi:hypothetical protein
MPARASWQRIWTVAPPVQRREWQQGTHHRVPPAMPTVQASPAASRRCRISAMILRQFLFLLRFPGQPWAGPSLAATGPPSRPPAPRRTVVSHHQLLASTGRMGVLRPGPELATWTAPSRWPRHVASTGARWPHDLDQCLGQPSSGGLGPGGHRARGKRECLGCNVFLAASPRPWWRRPSHLLLLNLGGLCRSRTTESSSS